MGLTTSHHKNQIDMKFMREPQAWTDSLDKQPKRQNMGMRFRTWNVRGFKLGLVRVLVRW
jgi:hypothetical protein